MKYIFTLLCFLKLFVLTLTAQVTLKQIRPSDTNPLITTFNTDSHYVYLNASVIAKNILVVHLPGSYGEPKRSTLFGTLAANLGFHSIGLMYPNIPTVGSFCTNSNDLQCFENTRREIIEGVDYSTNVAIASDECILSRLKKLLIYLKTNFPSENWGQYLDINNDIIYNKVIFSGHSQGGGHAALIGKYYSVKRVLCFSSPKDFMNNYNAPPSWLSSNTWQTNKSNIYAFNHTLDAHTQQLVIWDSLGLDTYGASVDVDVNTNPYSNTRQLATSYNVPLGDEHSSTIQDTKTPKVSGVPVFIPVWMYMLTNNLSVGIKDYQSIPKINIAIYPNPVNDIATLNLLSENYSITIYNQLGEKVMEEFNATGQYKLNCSHLKDGFYYVYCKSKTNTSMAKLVKQ
jgi:hypothetical protein